MGRITVRRQVTRVRRGAPTTVRADTLAVEEPLEIRVGGNALTITMRTPGHDFELAAGFLVSEGVIHHAEHFATARHCADGKVTGENTFNIVDVTLAPGVAAPSPDLARNFYTTSSCGLCGKASIEAIRTVSDFDSTANGINTTAEVILSLPNTLRDRQDIFEKTGGLHAAALFSATGELLVIREDVGRHNAVDKVIGWALMAGQLPLENSILQVSGRTSFELIQKAAMAGIPIVSAVSAPSSLAVELAEERGITLIGFVRDESFVIYTRAERIAP